MRVASKSSSPKKRLPKTALKGVFSPSTVDNAGRTGGIRVSTRTMDLLIVGVYFPPKTSGRERGKSNYAHAVKILNEFHDSSWRSASLH